MDLDLSSLVHRQNLFSSTLKSHFHRKIIKYQNVLLKNGIHLSEQSCNSDDILTVPRSQSFEDHIELVIGQKSASPNACKAFWKIGNRISTLKLFRWVYLIVQRTKAARILHHLDGISDVEILAVIQSAGQEITVAFEYQLCLLEGDFEIVKLAQHAGACILTYLNSADAHFSPENLLQAILEVKPQSGTNKEILRTRQFSFNSQPVCLRWRLSQVLKQPGLRIIAGDGSKVIKKSNLSEDKELSASGVEPNIQTPLCSPNNASQSATIENQAVRINADVHDIKIEDKNALDDAETGDANEHKIDNHKCVSNQTDLNHAEICRRRISTVDMDYDASEMRVIEYSVEVSDFSPIGNDTSQLNDGDSTSVDEDLHSNGSTEAMDSIKDAYQHQTCGSPASVPIALNSDRTACESTLNVQMNDAQNWEDNSVNVDPDNGAIHTEISNNDTYSTSASTDPFGTEMCNHQTGKVSSDKTLGASCENGAGCNKIYTGAITTEDLHIMQDNKLDISSNTKRNISSHETSHTKTEKSTQQAFNSQTDKNIKQSPHTKQYQYSDFSPECLHDHQGLQVYESGRHIRCTGHIDGNTYQSSTEHGSNSTDAETYPVNCDNELLPEFTIDQKTYDFYGCFTPYGAKCRPQIYGYRGPLHVWSETNKHYTLIYNDTVTVTRKHHTQSTQCPQNFHQYYIPKTVCKH